MSFLFQYRRSRFESLSSQAEEILNELASLEKKYRFLVKCLDNENFEFEEDGQDFADFYNELF